MKTKTCTKCGRELPPSAFGKHRLAKDGRAHRCKECARENAIKWNKTASGVYSRMMSRNKFYNRKPLIITRGKFINWFDSQERTCFYCGIPEKSLDLLKPRFSLKSSRLTIDCKDNEKGYVLGNLVLACSRCNSIKSDELTSDEMLDFGQKYLRPKWEKKTEG